MQTDLAAFVLDMGANGLGVVRSLAPSGIKVVGVDHAHAPGLKSRYCEHMVAPNPEEHPMEFLDILLRESNKFAGKKILYPCADEYVLFVSRHREALSQHFLFSIPSTEIVESLVNKQTQYQLAEKIGIPYPETFFPRDLVEVEEIKSKVRYPAVIKGYYSHIWVPRFGVKGFQVNNEQELIERYKEVFEAGQEALVQSVIVGPTENLVWVYSYFSEQHESLASFATRKLRQYPNDYGLGSLMESVHDEELVALTLKFLRSTSYRGLGTVEFKRDARDGNCKMIELNARLGLHNILPTVAGINFPLLQYLELTHQEIEFPKNYADGIKWLDLVRDFQAYRQLRKSNNFSFLDWLRSLRHIQCHALYSPTDPEPFLKSIDYGMRLTKLLRRI